MKALRLLFLMTLVLTLTTAGAQKVKTHKVWVTLLDDTKVRGTLFAVNENEFVILGENNARVGIDPKTIESISLRKEGNMGKGALKGAAGGAVIGAAIGLASTRDAYITQGEGALIGGLIGTPIGALIGAGIGSGKEKFTVNGNKDAYLSLIPSLQQYVSQKGV